MMTLRKLLCGVLIAVVFLGACTAKSPKTIGETNAPSPSPSSDGSTLMQSVVVAVRHAGSFHLRATTVHRGATVVFVQDVGRTAGVQDITIGAQRARILVINGVAYLRANRPALVQFMGFPSAVADRLHDRWVSFMPTDAPFTDIAASVTLDSALNEIAIKGAVTLTKQTSVLGQRVVGLTGNAVMSGTETLYVPASETPLPVQEILSANGDRETITFSKWGEIVRVTKPSGAIAFSSVVPSSGGGQTV